MHRTRIGAALSRWRRLTLAPLALIVLPLAAQTGVERTEGLREHTPRWHALTGARLVLAPGQVIERGTLVMRDGVIVAVGRDVAVPAGAREWKLDGRSVYAGFIDLNSTVGVPASLRATPPARPMWGPGSQLPPTPASQPPAPPPSGRALAARNRFVRPEQDVAQQLDWRAEEARAARELGFTAVLAAPATGVFRGQGALLNLGEPGEARDAKSLVLQPRAAQHMAHEFQRGRDAGYPASLMGAIALARQTLLDARWHRDATTAAARAGAPAERVEPNASLEALAPVVEGRQRVVYAAEDEQDFLRVARVRDEFGLRVIALGNGHEYRRAAQLKALALPVVVPLAFPAVPDVDNPDSAIDVPLDALQHWEQAPSNLALIDRAGVMFAVTAAGLRDARREFWPRLRQAVRRGLPAEHALAALTTVPAQLIGEQARLGRLAPGQIANLVVARGDLFSSDDAQVELAFVDGRPLPGEAWGRLDPRGTWTVSEGNASQRWEITGTAARPSLTLDGQTCHPSLEGARFVLRLPCGKAVAGEPAVIVAEAQGDRLVGTLQRGDGPLRPWSAQRSAPPAPAAASAPAEPVPAPPAAAYPAGAYGIATPPRPAAVLVRGATVWTSAAAGKLERTDLLVRDGRIAAIGTGLAAPAGALVIDAAGKHLTPGLIDAHSHTAIARGVNEGTHSVTAEVRIADVLDATDINLYRELAGGLTAANLLHGSANTIGGQSQVIKLRWGGDAQALVFDAAMPGIKFALGENVKGSNWGDASRYPQTRMGVEQVLRDAFGAARAYADDWARWRAAPQGRPQPRRDLQLEALVEILERKRAVHIHSYRADEILMFARLAKTFGITVAAFQHVLEGYKVADAIAEIGAGASTFSDWWAYKMEVMDAIPTNGALLHRNGVLTSFNSDSDELARRLNTEAAKAMKYGGLGETEALALVTINPARQLRIDGRTGSLEVGKDADFVLWSGHPLSTYSRAEQTWIDGRRYFDLDADRALREAAARDRERLVAAALRARASQPSATGEGRTPGGAPAGRPALAAADVGALPWLKWLDATRAWRDSYSDQGAWHECTEDAR